MLDRKDALEYIYERLIKVDWNCEHIFIWNILFSNKGNSASFDVEKEKSRRW